MNKLQYSVDLLLMESENSLTLKFTDKDNITWESLDELSERSHKFFDSREKVENVTIDLSDLSGDIDSLGLNYIVMLFKATRDKNGDFKITGVNQRIKEIFRVTGLAKAVNIEYQEV